MKHISLLLALLVALCSQLDAQSVPALVNYQGHLTDAAGAALPTADYVLTFNIYDAATGGIRFWGPQVFDGASGAGHGPKIPVVQGYFNVMLGPVDNDGDAISDAFMASDRFVEITIAGRGTISPRQQILSAPYAIRAGSSASADNAARLDGKVVGDFVSKSGDTMTGQLTLPSAGLRLGARRALVDGHFGVNALAINYGGDWPYTVMRGNVGIGHFQGDYVPSALFHVTGDNPEVKIEHNSGQTGGATLRLQGAGGSGNKVYFRMHGLTFESASGGGGDYLRIFNGSRDLAYFSTGGNVGIGTQSPAARLDVNGDILASGGLIAAADVTARPGGSGFPFVAEGSTGTFPNWMGTGASIACVPLVGCESRYGGFGMAYGENVNSPIVWFYGFEDRNCFQVRSMAYGAAFPSGDPLFTVRRSSSKPLVGIGTDLPSATLHVEGNAYKTAGGSSWATPSDKRIKRDVEPVDGALEALERVRLVSFRFTDEYRKAHPSIEDRRYLNVIAQEFAEVFPDAVSEGGERLADGHHVLLVDTHPLTIYSAAAVQELYSRLKSKELEIKALKQRLERLEQAVQDIAASNNGRTDMDAP